jgi:hypothetical protein
LCEQNIIRPVKQSGTNGSNPALYLKYHIIPQKKDYSEQLREIRALHPWISTDKFLKSPEKYISVRDIIYPLSEFIKSNRQSFDEPMSENERAYAVWRNEKILDDPQNISLLKDIGVFERLNTYPTPEPFFEYGNGKYAENILVIENKDTWFTIRKLLLDNSQLGSLFGVPIGCIIYGEGKKVTQKSGELQRFILMNGDFHGTVYYWGDLDYEGIEIYLLALKYNSSLNLNLFVPAYRHMLCEFENIFEKSENREIFKCRKTQRKPEKFDEFTGCFGQADSNRISELLNNGYYIPQEILNFGILKKYMG